MALKTDAVCLRKINAAITEHHIAASNLTAAKRASERLPKSGENQNIGTMVNGKIAVPTTNKRKAGSGSCPNNMVMFGVADLAAAESLVREAGGTIVSGTLAMDGGEAFFARDPDGNLLGFQHLPQTSVFTSRNFPDNGT